MLRAAVAIGLIGFLHLPTKATYAQSDAGQSSTAQWLAKRETVPVSQRYDQTTADAFGRECLGVHGRVPINWEQVKQQIAELITSEYALDNTVPADIGVFCPEYPKANIEQRRNFWREFALQVIKPEVGTNAHSLTWEQPRDDKGKPIGGEYSIGLLQLSISNRGPYGCDIPSEASLLDPKKNLACGVKILGTLVSREGIGGDASHGRSGAARYWSIFRVTSAKSGTANHRETRQSIIDAVLRLPQCSETFRIPR